MSPRGRWLALAAALLGWSFDGFEMGLFPVIARAALLDLLGAGVAEETLRQWYAVFSVCFLLGAAVGGVVFGWLGDRFGRVAAMSLAVLVYSALTGLSATARSAEELAGWRFFAATGMGGEWALGVALVAETWPERSRPWLAGLIGAAVNVGYIIAAILVWSIGPDRWRLALALGAVPAALTFFLRTQVAEPDRWRRAVAVGWPRLRELWQGPQWWATALAIVVASVPILAVWGAVQFTQLWAQARFGSAAGAQVQLVSALAASVGSVFAPVALARVHRGRAYGWLCGVTLVASLAFFVGRPDSWSVFLVGVAAVGLGTGGLLGWLALALPELFPTRLRATGSGLAYNAGRIVAAIGVGLLAGPINIGGDYATASAAISMVYIMGLLVAAGWPDRPGQLPE